MSNLPDRKTPVADPVIARAIKLMGVAVGLAISLGLLSLFLPASYRWFVWGLGGGMVATMLIFLIGSPRKARTPAMARMNAAKKIGWVGAVIVGILGAFFGHLLPKLVGGDVKTLLLGASLGVIATLGLILSPLFYKLPNKRS